MKHQITKNFWAHEIFPKQDWEDVPNNSQYLAEHLCEYTLQPLRNRDSKTIINISGPSRDALDVIRLEKQGYHPSVTTDHFFGMPQTIPAQGDSNLAKIEKYGSIYTYSVGAVDIKPDIPQKKNDFMKYFLNMIMLNEAGIIDAGQIILEKGKNTYWIHVSNPVGLVYQYDFVSRMGLQKTKYLTSLDNDGKYKVFNL